MKAEEIEFYNAKLVLAKRDLKAVMEKFRGPSSNMREGEAIYKAVGDALLSINRAILMMRDAL